MAKITLDNLAHSYLPNPTSEDDFALKELNHDWVDGEAYALLGASGCGKSTLLNIISGLLHPSQGRILFNDRDVTNDPTTKRNIAQVFQFPVVYDTMTVRDNLAFPLRNRGADAAYVAQRVQQIAGMIGMEDMLNRKARGLTADAKQKISLGRGMVREDVNALLFDEPLSNLDVQLRATMRTELASLLGRLNTTVVYVTHDVTEALALADRILVLDQGRAVQLDTARAVFSRPATPWVAAMAGFSSRLVPQVVRHDESTAHATFGGESLRGQACGEGPDGEPHVFIHPDAVTLAEGLHAVEEGTVSGVVQSCVYEGRGYRVTVHVADAGQVTVMSPWALEVATTVALAIDPEGVLVFGRAA